jgi:hypothetical protein
LRFRQRYFRPGNCFARGNQAKANAAIYDHGITQGGSDALNAQTLWIFAAVRPLHLLVFLKSIDGTTVPFRSEGDDFRDFVRLQGTCPAPGP